MKKGKNKNRSLKLLGLLAVLFFAVSTTMNNDHGKYFEIAKNIEIFTNLYKEVNTYYVDDLDPAKLMRTGVDAMLESLDPYTSYISESEIEGFRYITEGKYNGIGAQIRIIDDLITITEPYEGSPADKAGLKAGDQLLAVDGKSAKGKSSEEVNEILKGYPGTEVELTIKRLGASSDLKINLVRDEVSVPNVPYTGMVSDNVGYIALTTFTRDAGRNVGMALKDLKTNNENLAGVILDLRGNGGGLLAEAVNISNLFVDKGELVVTTKGKVKDWDRSFKTLNQVMDADIPLTVLIDNGSASASEIVSGVIQDLDRGVLMGQRSYGKGLVQNTRDVGYNSRVKMTIAKYYIPSGRCIQSVEYDDGEPADIPDNKREEFKTRSGRVVLDGGGVSPDVKIDKDGKSNILSVLDQKNFVFNFVTEFILGKESIGKIDDFHFTDWAGFLSFLEKRNFNYDTDSEKLLEKLKAQSKDDGYVFESDILTLENKIIEAKKADLEKNKDAIINMIEKEIIGRYYYQKGKIQIGLRNDKEIKEAVKILNDKEKYASLLK
ncbi:MAG: carboxyl-terminal processing protease [Paraglaciecola sp.]|jgi:carboxyl-terminal processing protease